MTDRFSARRQQLSTNYFALLSGVGLAIGLLFERKVFQYDDTLLYVAIFILSGVGISLCLSWQAIINHYVKISLKKYEVIRELESKLNVKPYTEETSKFDQENPQEGIMLLSNAEKAIPIIFLVPFSVFAIYGFINFAKAICH